MRRLLQKIDEWAGKIPLDCTLHVIVSAILVWVGMSVAGLSGCDITQGALIGISFALALGVIKETVIDTLIKGSAADVRDLAADVVGICIGVILMLSAALIY